MTIRRHKQTTSEFVICMICNEISNRVTNTHLKSHGMTFKLYKILFPESPITSIFTGNKMSQSKLGNSQGFKKGNSPHNKGQTKEMYEPLQRVSKKISIIQIGRKQTEKAKKNRSLSMKSYYKKHPEAKIAHSQRARNDIRVKRTQFTSESMSEIWLNNKERRDIASENWKKNNPMFKQINIERAIRASKNNLKHALHPNHYTDIEKITEICLIKLGYEINKEVFHNKMIKTTLGICVPDFIISSAKISIFCDGEYWHNNEKVKKKDKWVNHILNNDGWKVLRFPGKQIKSPDFKNQLKEVLQC